MTVLRIRKPGISSTLQDAGRRGYRALGVPGSGALDSTALTLVNALVGNEAAEAAIEMLYSGVTARVEEGSARVAVGGAEAAVERSGGAIDTVPAWQTVTLSCGDTLRVGAIRAAAPAYLAVEGGFEVPRTLGSASTYVRGAIGGYGGRALRRGDTLGLKAERASARAERRYARAPQLASPAELRVMPGPQAERFDAASLRSLCSVRYAVSPSSDRCGLRLEGEPLRHVGGFDLTSEGVAPGSIQVPGSGLPVILIGDHPTVGGYPKIATIVSADIAAAGRLRIGSSVGFSIVDEDEAAQARATLKRFIADTIADMCDAPP